jgi:tetratricopeptide (TPR) repeat protein
MSWQQHLQEGMQAHQAGQLPLAEQAYRRVLTAVPNQPDAIHLLGVLAHQAGKFPQAEALIRRALAQVPNAHAFHNSLGNVLRAQGRLQDAEAAYRAAISAQGSIAELHHNLGTALRDQGRRDEAEAAWRQALVLSPISVPAMMDLGTLLVETGQAAEAEILLRRAALVSPGNGSVRNTLGMALAAMGQHEAALTEFETASKLAAGTGQTHANALANRAASLVALDRMEDAAQAYALALTALPDDHAVRRAYTRVLIKLQRGAEAAAALAPLLVTDPDDADLIYDMGCAAALQRRTEDSLACMRKVCALDPARATAWEAQGKALRDLARWPEALPAFAEAARLAPENADIRVSYAYALLAIGDFQAAWPHFVFRREGTKQLRLKEPLWDGAPTEKTVFIHPEQGVGDVIQFARFIPLASERARMVVACQPSLTTLLRRMHGIAELTDFLPLPRYDLHLPVMDLPAVLGVQLQNFADPVPYLHAHPSQAAEWAQRLAKIPRPRVGLVWAGNPDYPADARRSMHFTALQPLTTLPGIGFISMQKGNAADQLPPNLMFDAAPHLDTFNDTAALIANLDLVIAVDTAVAHLAGAMGRPIWLLNRADTDWRWLLDRTDSPWYPSMRIFRQPAPGDWAPVVHAVRRELEALATS